MKYKMKIRDSYVYIDHKEGDKFIELMNEVLVILGVLGFKYEIKSHKMKFANMRFNFIGISVSVGGRIIELDIEKDDLDVVVKLELLLLDSLGVNKIESFCYFSDNIDEFLVPLEKFKGVLVDGI